MLPSVSSLTAAKIIHQTRPALRDGPPIFLTFLPLKNQPIPIATPGSLNDAFFVRGDPSNGSFKQDSVCCKGEFARRRLPVHIAEQKTGAEIVAVHIDLFVLGILSPDVDGVRTRQQIAVGFANGWVSGVCRLS